MRFEILDAKKAKLTEGDLCSVAEMHVHPEIRKWDSRTVKPVMDIFVV